MTKHPHADLIMDYAEIAQTTDKPWAHFQLQRETGEWVDVGHTPDWDKDATYRIKPRTIRIGEYNVPEPVREPLKVGAIYYIPCFDNISCLDNINYLFYTSMWSDCSIDTTLLKLGVMHRTVEDARLHAKALVSLTQAAD